MRAYFAKLSSLERRFVVGVLLIVFLLLNWWFVWPRFSDWKKLGLRGQKARSTLQKFNEVIAKSDFYKKKVDEWEREGQDVPLEDQSIKFMRDVQSQAALSGVQLG